jgi:F-type H+-transporting ATPase subunit b
MRSANHAAIRFLSGALLSLIIIGPVEARPDAEHGHEADGEKAVYDVEFHEGDHKTSREFDMAKADDRQELMGLLESGHAHELKKKTIPTLAKIASLGADLGLWTLVIFVLLFLILRWKAWPMMLEGLQRREQGIRSAIDEAHKAREETARLRDEILRERNKAEEEARATIDAARRDALKAADEMKTKALAEIRAERDRARRELELARDSALQDLWAQTAQLATLVSGRVIGRQLNFEDHRQLVDEAITDFRRAGAERKREIAGV